MATDGDGDGDGDWQQGYKRQCIVEGKERWVTQNLPGLCVILATGECVLVAASPNQQYCLNCATFPAYIGLGTSFEPSGRLNLWYCSSISSAQDLASCILHLASCILHLAGSRSSCAMAPPATASKVAKSSTPRRVPRNNWRTCRLQLQLPRRPTMIQMMAW